RRHGLQVCGDMGNTSACEVHLPDLLMTIIHGPHAIAHGTQPDWLADEGAAHTTLAAAERDAPFVLDAPYLVARRVFDGRQRGGERPGAVLVARSRCCV